MSVASGVVVVDMNTNGATKTSQTQFFLSSILPLRRKILTHLTYDNDLCEETHRRPSGKWNINTWQSDDSFLHLIGRADRSGMRQIRCKWKSAPIFFLSSIISDNSLVSRIKMNWQLTMTDEEPQRLFSRLFGFGSFEIVACVHCALDERCFMHSTSTYFQ